LLVCACPKCVSHLFQSLNVADVPLLILCVPLRHIGQFALRGLKQQPCITTNKLASETEIVSQSNEWIERIVGEPRILALGNNPKLSHVVLVTGRMRADTVTNKT
jgi:hypothetical protein